MGSLCSRVFMWTKYGITAYAYYGLFMFTGVYVDKIWNYSVCILWALYVHGCLCGQNMESQRMHIMGSLCSRVFMWTKYGNTAYAYYLCSRVFMWTKYVGLARTVNIHCIWPYIWLIPCKKYRICTVYIWFWPTLKLWNHSVCILWDTCTEEGGRGDPFVSLYYKNVTCSFAHHPNNWTYALGLAQRESQPCTSFKELHIIKTIAHHSRFAHHLENCTSFKEFAHHLKNLHII